METIQEFLVSGAFAFALVFVRMGTTVMLMPGIGDSFVSTRIRLHMAMGLAFVLFPLVIPNVPSPLPGTTTLLFLIMMEFIIGVFIGVIARIFMSALDVAGMTISFSASLSNATLFNPGLATQGSLIGAFLSVTGVALLFSVNLHHLLIMGVVESYELFPIGTMPDTGGMAELVARAVSSAFSIGVTLGAPFVVATLMVYILMGVLSRVMPQIQVLLLASPLQVLLSLILMLLVLSSGMIFWLSRFEEGMVFFLRAAGA